VTETAIWKRRIRESGSMQRMGTRGKAREIGLAEGLWFVYEGNVPGSGGEDTFCPGCGSLLIQRSGFSSRQVAMQGGCCEQCGAAIAGVWG